jgi:hypothetical protein
MADATVRAGAGEAGEKGLRSGALGMLSGIVIGVASTAPGYSLAASLGLVVAAVGPQAPAIMFLAFLPMLFIAAAYYYLNRADPDCGTTFAWVTRAMGPHIGWMGGWGIIVADIIVMANLAQIAGKYTFLLFNADGLAESVFWVTFLGCVFIAVLTWVCYVGIEASARTQYFLLGADRHPRHLLGGGPGPGLVRGGRGVDHPEPGLAQPLRHRRRQRPGRRHPGRGVHLLGLGLDRHRERGDPGLLAHPRRGRHPLHHHPGRHLRDRVVRRPSLRRRRDAGPRTPTTCWPRSAPRCSGHRGTSC